MTAPPRWLSPFVRTRTRLTCTLGLLLAALTAALLPWWQPGGHDAQARGGDEGTGKATQASAGPRDEATALAEARRSRKQVPVDTATTATTRTWALPNGGLRTEISALPRRAKSANGEWADLDTELTRDEKAPRGLGIRPVNAPVPVRFSSGTAGSEERADRSYARTPLTRSPVPAPGDTALAELELDGHTVTYTWPGPLPQPVLDGPRALYPEVMPGVDLLLVAREEGGFGQLLIVKTREAATQPGLRTLTYGLRSGTAVFRHDKTTGGVRVLDGEGEEIGSIPTPYAWDSSGRDPEAPKSAPRTSVAHTADVLKLSGLGGIEPGAHHAPMRTSVDGDGTGSARLHLDAATTGLFTDAETRFPVFLDPTLNSGWKAWTVAYKKHANTSFYNGTNFNDGTSDARVGYENETGGLARSFWRMGFDSGIKGATITSATFKVLNNHTWSCEPRSFKLALTGSISSGTTWNKQPAWKTEQQTKSFAHGRSGCADEYVSYNVKNAAQQAADGGWSNITLGMRAITETDTYTWRKFRATSATLSVTYNRPPATPSKLTTSPGGACVTGPGGGRAIAKTDIVLSANATDADGNLKGLRFRYWKTGTSKPAGTLITSDSSGKATMRIPTTALVDQTTYSWEVQAEDTSGSKSSWTPTGDQPCRFTIDASGPPAPDVTSDVFREATDDGATWATVKFGETGAITFAATDAVKFTYAFGSLNTKEMAASSGKATVSALQPPHSGPLTLHVYAYDAVGNKSQRTDYTFYLPPRDTADAPGDTGGDGRPDLVHINGWGNLRSYPGDVDGELYGSLAAGYTSDGAINPAGHWYNPDTGKAALITKYADTYPGDGSTDLFARTPDGGFWLYPGDGYGSFNVDKRLRVLLPSNAPDPATWTQIKAVGDVTGDKLPDLFLRAGGGYWALTGYTGGSFQEATLMWGSSWQRRDIVNVADIDKDGTADLLWRNLDNGNMYVRHGLPGTAAGSVELDSLKLASNSRDGDVSYGTGWTEAAIDVALGVPDLNGDGVPDIWTRSGTDGRISVYHPSTTDTKAAVKVVIGSDWSDVKGFG
ncbi:VCBS repeat-containing protein [Streptomyces sp. MUM 203J]|uniref:FG-GAP-like repeat-containing protein n=1 Tax=Streptomyces sp. MUM 203J TaxID=2791990 RepID=UPI001F036FFA|nr:DNRLRE domain-containing protein [Streptomyces sp. MUM 203J]MCH0541792.1 VCBS repeat-containing protein [Streptomyces sp. MUM 203J]